VIQGPDADAPATSPAAFTVFVEATGVTLRGFTVLGGSHGVHLSGPATAVIENNVIRGSGGAVHLDKESIGQILGNTIEGNKGDGVFVDRMSQADVVANAIDGNTGDGISARHGSGVNLSAEANGGVGVRCEIGGYVSGPRGSLTGRKGATRIDGSCAGALTRGRG
jgi:nitrous oxidase accessory protein NosD